jgi:hypothetical protein
LAFLSEKEVGFFSAFAAKPRILGDLDVALQLQAGNVFLVCRILAFRKPDPATPYCFIDVEFVSGPLSFKELMVSYFYEGGRGGAFLQRGAGGRALGEQGRRP